MNNERKPSEVTGHSIGEGVPTRSSQQLAAERRRLLLKGIGRGGALIGASVPLKTLAGQRLLTSDFKHNCNISGMQSGVHSVSPSNPVCTGFVPPYYGQSKDNGATPCNPWPSLPNGWNFGTRCRTVFRRSALTGAPSLFKVLNQPAYAQSDERHWICAWLNALRGADLNFPYTAQQVMDYYDAANRDALSFFKGFMETRAS